MTTPDPLVVALSLQVAELREKAAELELVVHSLQTEDSRNHKPREAVKWWDEGLGPESRELGIARLRGWERDVLIPVLGLQIAPCWPTHTPAVVRMEVMCELWMTLWLSRRTQKVLAAQSDYLIRQLPGLANDIKAICSRCEHAVPAPAKEVA